MATPAVIDNISELSAILKTVFGEGVEQQQNLAAMLYKRFGESGVRFGGNSYEFPARMVNTQSVGARGYRISLPEPILNIDVTARVRHKFIYGTFDITGPDIEKGKGNVNAFVNTLTDKMRSLTEMMLKDLNMQTYLDGTGVRATIPAGAVFTGASIAVDQVKFLRVGMQVNVISGADGVTLRGGTAGDSDAGDGAGTYFQKRFTISRIDTSTSPPTIQLSNAAGTVSPASGVTGVAVGDFLVRHKAIGAELTGLGAIVDDGVNDPGANVLQDIDRVANPLWRAKILNAGGGDITLPMMQLGMDLPEVSSGRRITTTIGSYNMRERYLQVLVPQKRFTDLKLDGGFQTLEYNGRDFLVDVDCPDGQILFLNDDSIEKYGLFDLAFVEQTGGILKHDSLSAGDVFYGYMRVICNLGTTQSNANAKIVNGIIDPNYVVAS
jgi:hypothetical protein